MKIKYNEKKSIKIENIKFTWTNHFNTAFLVLSEMSAYWNLLWFLSEIEIKNGKCYARLVLHKHQIKQQLVLEKLKMELIGGNCEPLEGMSLKPWSRQQEWWRRRHAVRAQNALRLLSAYPLSFHPLPSVRDQ